MNSCTRSLSAASGLVRERSSPKMTPGLGKKTTTAEDDAAVEHASKIWAVFCTRAGQAPENTAMEPYQTGKPCAKTATVCQMGTIKSQ